VGPLLLCNEVVREFEFAAQCELAAALGYGGLELAPFTLGEEPHRLGAAERRALRRAAEEAGIVISGLHWLLVTPAGLSITAGERAVRERTLEVVRRLIGLCAELGGRVLVHGSPKQRLLMDPEASARGQESLAAIAEEALRMGVTYCLEPLARQETNFLNTVAEAASLVEAIGSPALRAMVDCRAARLTEVEDVPALLERWLPTGLIGHIHLNDRNGRAPGQGEDRFAAVLAVLRRHGYQGAIGVEPFVYEPDGPTTAAFAAGYLKGLRAAEE
jgi:sugar phosphate isomerase/epimerase